MTMTISDLPRDLEEEILSRIPLKMMRAVRLTCKKWDTLSKNQSFMKKQAAKERNGNSQMFVLFMDYKLYLKSVVMNGIDVDPYTVAKGKLTCLNDSEQVEKISQIIRCEGLLLCILKETVRLVVWNPYLGQTIRIEPGLRKPCGHYALGYSNESELSLSSHKIMRFVDDLFYGGAFLLYEIYDFDTGLWKTLDFTSPHWRIAPYHRGVSLKGNTYWICNERESRETRPGYIICFDFTRERFGQLLPLPRWAVDSEFTSLSCVGEEKLAALSQYNEASKIEIWITTKIEAEEVLWSKFLTVNMDPFADIPIPFTDGTFLIDEEKKLAMFFDTSEYNQSDQNLRHTVSIIGEGGRHYREVDLGEDGCVRKGDCWTHMCSYVPSLVQLKQGGCKREKQSNEAFFSAIWSIFKQKFEKTFFVNTQRCSFMCINTLFSFHTCFCKTHHRYV